MNFIIKTIFNYLFYFELLFSVIVLFFFVFKGLIVLSFFFVLFLCWFFIKPLYRRFVRLYYLFWIYLRVSPSFCSWLDKLFLLYSRLYPRPKYDEDKLSGPLTPHSHMDEAGDIGVVLWKGKVLFCDYLISLDYILCGIHRLNHIFKMNGFDYPENRPFELSSMINLLKTDSFKNVVHFIDPVVPDLYEGCIPEGREGSYLRRLYHESVDLFPLFGSRENLKYLFSFSDLVFRRGYGEYSEHITRFGTRSNFRELLIKDHCSSFCRLLMPFVYNSFSSYLSEFVSSYYFQYSFFKRDFFLCFYLSFIGLVLSFFNFPLYFLLIVSIILFDFFCLDSNKYLFWFSFVICFVLSYWGCLVFFIIIPFSMFFSSFFSEFIRLVNVNYLGKINLHKAMFQF